MNVGLMAAWDVCSFRLFYWRVAFHVPDPLLPHDQGPLADRLLPLCVNVPLKVHGVPASDPLKLDEPEASTCPDPDTGSVTLIWPLEAVNLTLPFTLDP